MITNTELCFINAKEFQDKRSGLMNEYEENLKKLDRFKGSRAYDEDRKKLDDKLESDLTDLRTRYRHGFNTVLGSMVDAIGKRSVSAPTNDQINLLNVLKMKKKVTLEDCQRTAEAVKDNPIAVSIVSEIAQDHGYHESFDYLCPEMSTQRASDIVTGMKNEIEDFLQYDTTKASRASKRHHEIHYGTSDTPLTKRPIFNTQEEFYKGMGLEGNDLSQFSNIVDTIQCQK